MPDPKLLLGIEIGGTKLQLGLGRGDGTVLALERRTVDPARGAPGILRQIEGALTPLLGPRGLVPSDLGALGIGFGGPVDPAAGVVTTSHQVEGWAGFPLADWARTTLGFPRVALQNDADTAGLAEARFGAGVGRSPLLYVTIGSGIGGGLILGGQIYRGAGLGAAEVGHLRVADPEGPPGARVILESVASGWGIASAARRVAATLLSAGRDDWEPFRRAGGVPERITTHDIAESARAGDAQALALIARATDAVAEALCEAVTLLGPARIVLGGGVSLLGEELWFGPIRRALASTVFAPFRGSFDVVPAALGEEVVFQGALAVARDLAQSPEGSQELGRRYEVPNV